MPKRVDIKKILIIGAGPIVIGQACEFDQSGAQACKSLKEEGYKVILINSNPATIMTDPDLADKTYIEAITKEFVEQIIKLEKPDALSKESAAEIKGMIMADEEGELVTRDVRARFVNGNPSALEATYIWKSEVDFNRFMRFAERYAKSHGLGYSEAKDSSQ